MEQQQGKKRKKKNRAYYNSVSSSQCRANMRTMFPEMLASLLNLHTSFARSLLKKHLQKLLHLLSLKHKTLTLTINNNSFLSLLPILLIKTSKYPSLTRLTAEIIGAFSLSSFEANEIISSDDEILKALMDSLVNPSKRVSIAACNAVLDISTTSVGRRRLCELSAVEKLISVFLQDSTSPAKYVFQYSGGSGSCRIDALSVLVLDAAITLINNSDLKQLTKIPRELSGTFLGHLKEVWASVRDKIRLQNVAECCKERNCTLSNARIHDLAESIFRLSLNQSHCTSTCTSEVVKQHIFGPNHSEFEHFMLNCWENSPFLFRRLPKPLNDHEDSFSSFFQSFNSKRTLDVLLSSILGGLVSCPPLPSDDLDILSFLKEVKDGLGCPIIYEQDIRVLKTVDVSQGHMKREVHFLKERTSFSKMNDPNAIDTVDVRKCEESFLEGYTVALRGMEFRSENIAAIADGLAALLGQPSVGANAYLTPPRSQGLARHYDDHCVFVCQLLGQKRWTVLQRKTLLLPRLYEPLHNFHNSEDGTMASECQQFLLGEGDILYIPRGCPHEAYTAADDGGLEMDDASTGFSLHLTLGIEVEPPFEWEGFAHVALHCWNRNQKQLAYTPTDPLSGILNVMSINLLHISIQLIGCRDPVFRKACMVISFSLSSDNEENQQSDVLDLSQRSTFRYVVNCIGKEACFLEAFKSVEAAIQEKNEDLFQRMRWLRHLYHEEKTEGPDWNTPLTGFENLLQLYNGKREDAEAAFTEVKSKFCRDVVFENVCESFKILFQKYKSTRKQYMNGMLSLHCT
ncbi:JmjC domain [Macleaya cordata]|uniref:Bifunctional lysine-specific demethylase and histidyl-hydroxylase n=1 Tax=Macleaya cordata TaxID=56857 RepID=A0A200QRF8_MACCD|nr:JmjC domain [Macleaya cordata]